jgi:hypothetical protein
VLLAGDTDAEDRLPVDIGREQGAAGGEGEGVEPLSGVLARRPLAPLIIVCVAAPSPST